MHELYKDAMKDLHTINCEKYCVSLIKIIAALTQAIDESSSPKKRNEILTVFLDLIRSEDGIS